jgi:hypothetical protein
MSDFSLRIPPEWLEVIAERVADMVAQKPEPWLTKKELAEHWRCAPRTIDNYVKAGMPKGRHGTKLIFKASECEAWLDARQGRAYDRVDSRNGAAQPPEAPGRPPAPGPQEAESYGQEAA